MEYWENERMVMERRNIDRGFKKLNVWQDVGR
jgi:hypothetical protein